MTGAMTQTSLPVSRIALFGAAALAIVAVGIGVSRRAPAPAATAAAGVPAETAADGTPQPDVESLISKLEAKLKQDPANAEGWRMLGWSFFETGRYAESATAYRRAATLAPTVADYWSSLGEALVLAGKGDVPDDAADAFKRALAIDAKDPRARYFLAVRRDIAGDHKGAIDDWFALLADTPAGAPWEDDLRKTIERVGAKEKIDVALRLATVRRPPATPPVTGPSPDQMSAASRLPPAEQEAMIRGMVDGLAAKLAEDPKQPDRWMMLIRSRMQLGQSREAAAALQQAIAANPASRAALVEAAKAVGVPGA